MTASVELLAERLVTGDRRALSRAISLLENRDQRGAELLEQVFDRTGSATTIGFTGPPGVGKSTLISALVAAERNVDRSVGVLSVDPSSTFNSGAVLGDRVRLSEHFLDPHVFIRSMASRGALGGLARATVQAQMMMDAAGLDVIMLETIGVGQSEIDVADRADSVVLVLMPGAGDAVQALKSGIMEIPDVIVVNRAADPRAKDTKRHVRDALSLRAESDWEPPLLLVDSTDGTGIDDLREALRAHRSFLENEGRLEERRRENLRKEIASVVVDELAVRVKQTLAANEELSALVDEVSLRKTDPLTAARRVLNGLV